MGARKAFTYSGAYAPLPVRLVNSAARGMKSVPDGFNSLDMQDLLTTAGRKTGLTDWGDQKFWKALGALLDSVKQEGNLTFFGRFAVRQFLLGNLITRLRVVEASKRFPEIKQQTIRQPIFVVGWHRTGTTFLHNLLSSHPQLRAPLYWELRYPCPANDPRSVAPQKIIRLVKLTNRIHRYLAPDFNAAHPMAAEKPEECLHLFENACAGTTAFFITEAKAFAWWLLEQNIQHAYAFFKMQLKLLNWLRPGPQWILKWPYHLWHLATLVDTFPDAYIIHVHRDPCEVLPSVCSLAALARSSFCENIDETALGRFWLDYNEIGLRRGLTARTNINPRHIIDIRYMDLVSDPLEVVKQVLVAADVEIDESWMNALRVNRGNRRGKKHATHEYELSQFGLDKAEIRERFAGYMKDYELVSTET